jgi:predicted dehydrogenase
MTTLRAGVAGAGVFGGYHARKYAEAQGVELVGIYDRGTGRAETLAELIGASCYLADQWDDFVGGLDVLTIAAPAMAHASLAVKALEKGVHVYVEKPIAATVQESEAILAAGREAGKVVACGHQERIVFQEMGLFSTAEKPVRVEAVRKGPWTGRSDDVSVVLDLMIHDLDLALALAETEATSVTAKGRSVESALSDDTRAEIIFDGGMTALFHASRIAEGRERSMKIVYPSGTLEIDFMNRTFENSTGFDLNPHFSETARGRDPLGASVADFLAAVRGDKPRPAVTGEEAAQALMLALAVDQAAGT